MNEVTGVHDDRRARNGIAVMMLLGIVGAAFFAYAVATTSPNWMIPGLVALVAVVVFAFARTRGGAQSP